MIESDVEQATLEAVTELPVSIVQIDSDSIAEPQAVNNQVSLHLQTGGLAFQLQTQPASLQVVELAAKLDLVTCQLKESQGRLESAFFRIGYLEAQLERKQEELQEARQQFLA
jgi:hypothetical protein